MTLDRRNFLTGGAALACAAVCAADKPAKKPGATNRKPFEGIGDAPFVVGEPCLQAPAATTMGVTWTVSGLAQGCVEFADNPDFQGMRVARPGGLGLIPIDIAALSVRLEGLKPNTRYWYRTVTTPFTDYKNIYAAKLGARVTGRVHTFKTLGTNDKAPHFCVMNDTHAHWRSFEMITNKVKELQPTALIWNGDATNTTQEKKTAIEIFLNPPVPARDYAADIPVFFESGNHDFRGSWISKKEEVMMPRHPAERSGAEWDLKWNFAERLGDLALIGLDTGEDKPDAHPKWFGLANFEPYRKAQAAWLRRTFARPEIAAAPFKVVFCHIPLYAAPNHPTFPHDGVKIDPHDFAHWSRECHDLWAPILEENHVQLVIAAHVHQYRCDPAEPGRCWAQICGGGPECGISGRTPDKSRFPTVIEGKIEAGKLVVRVHDVFNKCVAATHVFERTSGVCRA